MYGIRGFWNDWCEERYSEEVITTDGTISFTMNNTKDYERISYKVDPDSSSPQMP